MNLVGALLGSGVVRSLIAGVAGFLVYGGWAYFVNVGYGEDIGIRSGLVQGSYSLVLTFSSTILMELISKALARASYRVPITILVTICLLFATAYGINYVAGTPEILMTILPGFVIGSGYTVTYVSLFLKKTNEDVL